MFSGNIGGCDCCGGGSQDIVPFTTWGDLVDEFIGGRTCIPETGSPGTYYRRILDKGDAFGKWVDDGSPLGAVDCTNHDLQYCIDLLMDRLDHDIKAYETQGRTLVYTKAEIVSLEYTFVYRFNYILPPLEKAGWSAGYRYINGINEYFTHENPGRIQIPCEFKDVPYEGPQLFLGTFSEMWSGIRFKCTYYSEGYYST